MSFSGIFTPFTTGPIQSASECGRARHTQVRNLTSGDSRTYFNEPNGPLAISEWRLKSEQPKSVFICREINEECHYWPDFHQPSQFVDQSDQC